MFSKSKLKPFDGWIFATARAPLPSLLKVRCRISEAAQLRPPLLHWDAREKNSVECRVSCPVGPNTGDWQSSDLNLGSNFL